MITTPTFFHTVDVLCTLAKRLQRKKVEKIPVKHKPSLMIERDWQVYVVASLPNLVDELAGRLLESFMTIRKVFQAKVNDLGRVRCIGRIKAKKIIQLLDQKYTQG